MSWKFEERHLGTYPMSSPAMSPTFSWCFFCNIIMKMFVQWWEPYQTCIDAADVWCYYFTLSWTAGILNFSIHSRLKTERRLFQNLQKEVIQSIIKCVIVIYFLNIRICYSRVSVVNNVYTSHILKTSIILIKPIKFLSVTVLFCWKQCKVQKSPKFQLHVWVIMDTRNNSLINIQLNVGAFCTQKACIHINIKR